MTCGACGFANAAGSRFCSACGAPLAAAEPPREERKVVTVLFADLVGFTSRSEQLDPEDVRALLRPYYARLRSELERFGGTVEKFIGDAVMAVFGAPVAHEDDSERAVRAALAIRDWIAGQGDELRARIAVNTGEALVTLEASAVEGEGMVAGDVVNTAARLQSATPVNGVLVGEQTYRLTKERIDYHESEPVSAKGKAEPIPVWVAVSPRARVGVDVVQTGRTPLVGRERELAALLGALEEVTRARTSRLVTLVGVPGIGKSRLVWELFVAVDQSKELVVWRQGRSLPYGEGVSFWALGEMVKGHAGILDTDDSPTANEKLGGAVADVLGDDPEREWVESHARTLVGTGDQELGGDRRGEAFAAWRRFFEALAEQHPLVLVFEDLHWADDGLLDFVDYLAERVVDVPLLLVATARPELLDRRPGWGGGKPNGVTTLLEPLSDDDSARLIAALLEQTLLPADVQRELLARAGGNPLFAEQYVRMLVDRGFLVRRNDGWALEAGHELPFPESLQAIIAARLDALPATEKTLLHDAAVVGKVFWLGSLIAVGGGDRFAADDRLHALARKDFVRRERRSSVGGETEYAFRHALLRDVAYGQIPRADRAAKHRHVAEWIESLSAERAEDVAEMLAHHYTTALDYARATGQQTGDLEQRARDALRAAGDRAASLGAHTVAVRVYAQALRLWPRIDPERAYVLASYGKALNHAESRGSEELDEAAAALLALGDRDATAEARFVAGEILWRLGRRADAFERFEAAVELVRDAPPSDSKVYVTSLLVFFRLQQDRAEEALRWADETLRDAEAIGSSRARAQAVNFRGLARLDLCDAGGLDDLAVSVEISRRANTVELAACALNYASALVSLGQLQRAGEYFALAREAAERFGHWSLRWIAAEDAAQAFYAGRWDDAVAGAEAAIGGSDAYVEAGALQLRSLIRSARGDDPGARADAERMLTLAREIEDPQVLFPSLAAAARVMLGAGDEATARQLAEELVPLLRQGRKPLEVQAALRDLAPVLAELGQGVEIEAIGHDATLRSRWLDAAVALAAGSFVDAASVYEAIGSRPDAAYARLLAAEQLRGHGRMREAHGLLEQALAFYRSVDAVAFVRRGEAALAASA